MDNKATAEEPVVPEWAKTLGLDHEGLTKLKRKLKMKRRAGHRFPEPSDRLEYVLRYLVTGEGYDKSCYHWFQNAFDEIATAFIRKEDVPYDWHALAKGFETKWNVPNCVGAFVLLPIIIPTWVDLQSNCANDCYFMYTMVDADLRLLNCGVQFMPRSGDRYYDSVTQNLRNVPETVKRKTKYFIVADERFEPQRFLRVLESAKTPAEREMIRRALEVGELALQVVYSRFQVFHKKFEPEQVHGSINFMVRLVRAVAYLHNHFLVANPQYARGFKAPAMGEGYKQRGYRPVVEWSDLTFCDMLTLLWRKLFQRL